ncbi:MAG: hypothetical protein IJU90_09135 [Bacteroidales bacterium]|nr:hypothetical protein [Bacteroidales bacterium]
MNEVFNKEDSKPGVIDKILSIVGICWRVLLTVFFVASLPDVGVAIFIAVLFVVSLLIKRWRRNGWKNSSANKEKSNEQIKEMIELTDEILFFSNKIENDEGLQQALERHSIKINDVDGRPLCGEGREIRGAVFVDVAHCYGALVNGFRFGVPAENAVAILLLKLLDRQDVIIPLRNGLVFINKNTREMLQLYVSQVSTHNYASVGDYGFIVASVLADYNRDLASSYLDLLYRLSEMVAKSTNAVSERQQAFLNKIKRMQDKVNQ